MQLRELIREVRSCKTAADERACVAKELALIRTALKGSSAEAAAFRHRNVAKLLYVHMLGYPTHFAQIECINLAASPKFAEKRSAYDTGTGCPCPSCSAHTVSVPQLATWRYCSCWTSAWRC